MRKTKKTLCLLVTLFISLTAICIVPSLISASHAQGSDKTADQQTMVCPKCKGRMEAGMILDWWESNSFSQSTWGAGKPKGHLFTRPKTKNVVTYCCNNCGYLESYAK